MEITDTSDFDMNYIDRECITILCRIIHKPIGLEFPQHDVLQAPSLNSSTVKDTSVGILLPAVTLGTMTDMNGSSGYNKGDVEYNIHFKLGKESSDILKRLCYANLKQEFINNTKSFQPFIEKAFSLSPSENDIDAVWAVFKSMARFSWLDDGSFMIKHRKTKKNPISPCVRSAEGVDHSDKLTVASGSVVRLDVRILSWSFKEMFGTSIKLGVGGIIVYRSSSMPSVRSSFLPGNFYLCIRPKGDFEIRDATGHALRVKVPARVSKERLLVDRDFIESVKLMENKLGCPWTCVEENDDEKYISINNMGHVNDESVVITPTIVMNKSMRTLQWRLT